MSWIELNVAGLFFIFLFFVVEAVFCHSEEESESFDEVFEEKAVEKLILGVLGELGQECDFDIVVDGCILIICPSVLKIFLNFNLELNWD